MSNWKSHYTCVFEKVPKYQNFLQDACKEKFIELEIELMVVVCRG
jgi:hypothetical protein